MTYAHQMIDAAPRRPAPPFDDVAALVAAIDACLECAQACAGCADACLSEDRVADLRRCIRLNADCADVCAATVAVLTRAGEGTEAVVRALLVACMEVCRACGQECANHAQTHEHCAVCADACRRCEAACEMLLRA